jgi:hypothetical protein
MARISSHCWATATLQCLLAASRSSNELGDIAARKLPELRDFGVAATLAAQASAPAATVFGVYGMATIAVAVLVYAAVSGAKAGDDLLPAVRNGPHDTPREVIVTAGTRLASGVADEAADGTRTHDLLHGKKNLIRRCTPLFACKVPLSARSGPEPNTRRSGRSGGCSEPFPNGLRWLGRLRTANDVHASTPRRDVDSGRCHGS